MDKKLIAILAVGLVILVGGGFLVLSGSKKTESVTVKPSSEEQISVIKPEEIGLSLTASSDNRKVIMEVKNTQNLTSLDYELSYTSKGDIPRGVIGHIDVKQSEKSVKQEITLGTCSDVCHYDEDVSNITLILKVAKTDGSTASVQESLEL